MYKSLYIVDILIGIKICIFIVVVILGAASFVFGFCAIFNFMAESRYDKVYDQKKSCFIALSCVIITILLTILFLFIPSENTLNMMIKENNMIDMDLIFHYLTTISTILLKSAFSIYIINLFVKKLKGD